ncbi:MAG: TonB-dependent receptor, partial [Pseudomonadota bacterium]
LTPSFLEGFSLTIDYYDIEIEDGIGLFSPEGQLIACIEGNDALCDNVQRGATGNLWVGSDARVSAISQNLAVEQITGYDIVATYDFDIGRWGSINLHDVLAYIDKWTTQETSDAPKTDCAGVFSGLCGFPAPEVRNNLRATWITPWRVTTSAQWRYISSVDDFSGIRDLRSANYFDISALWDVTDWAQLRAGVNNVTDKAPPIVGSTAADNSVFGEGNTFPGMYDATGRYFFIGASLNY